jgi:hypothetical protein
MMKKWHWALGTISVIIVVLIFLQGTGEKAVSNFYFIPAGTFSPLHGADDPTGQNGTTGSSPARGKISFDERQPVPVLASFGEPVDLQVIGINSSHDFYNRLQKVTNESDEDLKEYYFPAGPILGFGYDDNGTVVLMNKFTVTNETTIKEIYRIIEKHGEENGIKKIPGTFFSVDTVKLD